MRGKPEGKDLTKQTKLDWAEHHEMVALEMKREQVRKKIGNTLSTVRF